MKVLYSLLIFNVVFCASSKTEQGNRADYLEILQIKHEKLLSILDSIIRHQKQCIYYTPELIFCIHPRNINDTIVEIQIEAIGSVALKSDRRKGCFDFGGHLFLVTGDEYKAILKNTNKKRQISYYRPNKDEIAIYEDDTYSMWIYHYINDDFIFKEMWEMFCKEPCLDRDGLMKR
jgi:hypothetical protein